ncbi:MAG: ParB/RepB/Spo0J family partition protein [Bacillota bacterium]
MRRALWLKGFGKRERTGMAAPRADECEVREIPVDSILFIPYQPRDGPGDGLEELCESIKAHGVIQPVIVRRTGAGYELVAGERRVRACKMAGMERIPAIVRDYDDRSSAVAALIENVQRAGLQPLDEAEAYRRLAAEFHLTQGEVARAVGLSQAAVANKIRLLKLCDEVKAALRSGRIAERHGRALLRLEGSEAQARALDTVLRRGLSVGETEALVEEVLAGNRGGGPLGGRRRLRMRVGVFKDVRLFVNSFRAAINSLRRAGIAATLEERESETEIEMTMRIPKAAVNVGLRRRRAGARAGKA